MTYHKIPVEELEFGMYVAELDRPWTETPFMFQGLVLKTEQQLKTIRQYCKWVHVDPEKAELPDAPRSGGPVPQAKTAAHGGENVRGNAVYRELVSIKDELPRARAMFTEASTTVQTLSRATLSGGALDGERAQEAVTQITDSVVRNPDAMMLLAQIGEKSAGTLSRAVQISVYMTVFGRFLQLPRARLEVLGLMGLLQDVGMLKLPAGLPERRGQLTREEEETFKTHIAHSVEILSKTRGLPGELPALASLHHERYDGSGYPRGLKGKAIAMVGSIAAIVDTFDILTAPAPYGEQMSPSNALNVLYMNRGTQFNAALVEQYIQCVGAFPVGTIVELNSGETGIVIAQNLVRRLQPRILVFQDANGNPLHPHKILDLIKEPKVSPDEPYRIRRSLESSKVKIDTRELFL